MEDLVMSDLYNVKTIPNSNFEDIPPTVGNIVNMSLKFSTESTLFKPDEYFSKAIKVYEEFDNLFTDDPKQYAACTATSLLEYSSAPAQFFFMLDLGRKKITSAIRDLNKATILNNDLATVRHRSKYSNKEILHLRKYAGYEFTALGVKEKNVACLKLTHDYDPVLFIKVYVPFTSKNARHEQIKLQEEIAMTCSQTLQDLARIINCPMDRCRLNDLSHEPGQPLNPDLMPKRNIPIFPGSLFLIGRNIYCNGPNDLSDVLKTFITSYDEGPCETHTCDVQFGALQFQLGRPYLYQHQGQCEHIIMISNIHLQNRQHSDTAHYPRVIGVNNANPRHCVICVQFYPRWLVRDCERLPVSEAQLCHKCFLSYCYKDGKKICEFSAYEYIDSIGLQ